MNTIQLMQGSPQWSEYRRSKIGASDAPVITGRTKFGKTPYMLYMEKLGLLEPQPVNEYITSKGHHLEPIARAKYEALTGFVMQPQCVEHPNLAWMFASLDGCTIDGDLILEIKYVGADALQTAINRQVHPHYADQLCHQLAVTGAEMLHYFCIDAEGNTALVEVCPDQGEIDKLIDVETAFWQRVQRLEAPPMTDRDFVTREDADWLRAAEKWETANAAAKAAAETAEAWRQRLCELAGANSAHGGGVRVTRYMEHGRVSYAKIPALKELDLNAYRGAPSLRWRVTNGEQALEQADKGREAFRQQIGAEDTP